MAEIRNVRLELLRPGPAHNQLLSPLTPYVALCGNEGPVTISVPFEHRQLLNRLERLRYATPGGAIPASQREAEVQELGRTVGAVLGSISTLGPVLRGAAGRSSALLNVRLVHAPAELALVPFELAIAPEGFPGSGKPLLLQSQTPVVLTREIRRGSPPQVSWRRPPKILFAFASPGGVAPVPYQEHLDALRAAIDPWVPAGSEARQLAAVRKLLTVLPNASVASLQRECASTEYTHVHILAHGHPYQYAGEQRYGLAFCQAEDAGAKDVVDGESLASVLRHGEKAPTVVSLATCDSGNEGSVLTPGGSIAHDLHSAGIPWVIASQFPLWMLGSVVAARVLYAGLLRGDDPREVLYELRRELRTTSAGNHDWASIVAYASIPWDFEKDVSAFRSEQTRRRIDACFSALEAPDEGQLSLESMQPAFEKVRSILKEWRESDTHGSPAEQRAERAERLGMSGVGEKRIAYLLYAKGEPEKARAAVRSAVDWYRQAFDVELTNHWVLTQCLSLSAVLEEPCDSGLWVLSRLLASADLRNPDAEKRAWAHGTLAELEMLGIVYEAGARRDITAITRSVVEHCKEIRDSVGADAFPVFSTRRQFERYLDWWKGPWADIAKAAAQELRE